MAGHRLLMKTDGEESGVPGAGGVPGHGPVRIDDSVQRPPWVPGHHVPGGVRAGSDFGDSPELSGDRHGPWSCHDGNAEWPTDTRSAIAWTKNCRDGNPVHT